MSDKASEKAGIFLDVFGVQNMEITPRVDGFINGKNSTTDSGLIF